MNILNKINIHPTTYFILFISTLTGQFRSFTLIFLIILIHELGHILVSKLFDFKINKINILPFGGNIVFDIKLNESSLKEFIVLIAGPVFQIVGTLLIISVFPLSIKEITALNNFSYSLLLFNLLPIYPLDGSKILFLLSNNFLSYKKSHIILIFVSVAFFLLLIFNFFNLTIQMISIFLIIKTYDQYKNHNNIINRFLLERYLYKKSRGHIKIIRKLDVHKIWKNRNNIFINKKNYIPENEMLDRYFKNKKIY